MGFKYLVLVHNMILSFAYSMLLIDKVLKRKKITKEIQM